MIRLQERLVSSVTRFSWEFSGHRYAFFFVSFLLFSLASFTESCSFWYGLKDLT